MRAAILVLALAAPAAARHPGRTPEEGRATPDHVQQFHQAADTEPSRPTTPAKPGRARFGPFVGPAAWLSGVI